MMRNKPLAVSFLIAAAAVAGAAVLQAIEVKYQPVVGTTYEYAIKGAVSVMGQDAELKGTAVTKIVKVEGDKYVEQSTQNLSVSMGGTDMGEQPASTTTTTYALGGKVLESEGEGTSARTEAMSQFIEPGKALKIGDSWTHEAKADAKREVPSYKIDYKYIGDEKVGEWDCAKFTMNAKETEGEKPQVFDTTLWLSKTDWSRVKSETKFQNMTNPMVPAPLDGTLSAMRTK